MPEAFNRPELRDKSIELFIHYPDGRFERFIAAGGGGELMIGRMHETSLTPTRLNLDDRYLSRKHCRLFWDDEKGWMLEDLNSRNGTRWSGESIVEPVPVQGGISVQIGMTALRIVPGSDEKPTYSTAAAKGSNEHGDMTEIASADQLKAKAAEDFQSTQMFSAPLAAAASSGDSDETVVGGAAADDATLVEDAGIDEDATAVQAARAGTGPDTGVDLDFGEEDATEVGDGGLPEATAKGAPFVPNDDVTDVGAAEGVAPSEPDADATVVSEADDVDATAVSGSEDLDATTVSGGDDDEATEVAGADQDGVTAVGIDVEPVASGSTSGRAARTASAEPSGSTQGPPPGITVDDLPDLPRGMVKLGLMNLSDASAMLAEARSTSGTFFRLMADKRSARHIHRIYEWVEEEYGYKVLSDTDEVYSHVATLDWLPVERARSKGCLVLEGDDGARPRLACIDPFDLRLLDWVQLQDDRDFEVCVVTAQALYETVERISHTAMTDDDDEVGLAINISKEEEETMAEQITEIEVPKIVNFVLHRASIAGASDIHIEPTEERLLVRLRVNGILYEERSLPRGYIPEVTSRLKIMSGMNVAEKRRPQDGRIGVAIRGKPIDVRVSTYPTVHGEKVVMRLLDKSALRPSPEALGLLDRDLRLLKDKLHAPYGLIMISGPTGSGKTTTLYSCLGSIDKQSKNVLTVEDPVEYQMGGVHQMQVNQKIGLTFASGLRTILRQDPDVIMVGECRDSETGGMAIQASLTGHVVFSTIHTNDAVGVVSRLIDMGIERFLVASALTLAIAQRLVREICPHCRAEVTGQEIIDKLAKDGISRERLDQLGVDIDDEMEYAEGKGCKHCRQTGYGGRRAVFEVFEIDESVRSLIASDEFTDARLRELARNSGMTTLLSHGLKLVDDEVTTFAEVIRVLGETT
ncbi:MAG: ATPase, T2SS/T4P/T4SS family [Gammaproteobacteria bacterium]